ncbi:hypothetical protein PHPALM_29760 [Phytophthora palmivora]|uniref:Uncharacterized protein n=1 Tax=Phytophthora palmivora TaxID=4796 RepID=A0A2P4X6T8_9STRA|nr:hypothetical protein PHPALM_29760 [Phytophthora palmivora]
MGGAPSCEDCREETVAGSGCGSDLEEETYLEDHLARAGLGHQNGVQSHHHALDWEDVPSVICLCFRTEVGRWDHGRVVDSSDRDRGRQNRVVDFSDRDHGRQNRVVGFSYQAHGRQSREVGFVDHPYPFSQDFQADDQDQDQVRSRCHCVEDCGYGSYEGHQVHDHPYHREDCLVLAPVHQVHDHPCLREDCPDRCESLLADHLALGS